MRIYLESIPFQGQPARGWRRLVNRFKSAIRSTLVIEFGKGIPKD